MLQPGDNVTSGVIQVGDVSVAYDVRGAGMPLLLVPGFTMSRAMWGDSLCDLFVKEGFLVVRMDNRDSGLSSRIAAPPPPLLGSMIRGLLGLRVATPYTLSDMASDALGLMRALGHDRFHVCGASMGGMIAQVLAIDHPEAVRSLTSIMSTTGDRIHSIGDPRALLGILRPTPTEPAALHEHMLGVMKRLNGPALPFEEARVAELLVAEAEHKASPVAALRQFTAILAAGSRSAALRTLRVPALVVHGTHDPLMPVRGGRATAKHLAGARFLALDGMGHVFHSTHLQTMTHAIGELARTVT